MSAIQRLQPVGVLTAFKIRGAQMKPALFKMYQIGIENLNERMLDVIGSFPTVLSFCHSCLNNVG